VRELLNSWRIPNDTRIPTDLLGRDLAVMQGASSRDAVKLRALREDLRTCIEDPSSSAARLNAWIRRLGASPVVAGQALCFEVARGAPGRILGIVLAAIADGQWSRLKACPDCRWVFYDHTRNGSKRWCLMYAGGPRGRACGTIAKVRRYRQRRSRGRRVEAMSSGSRGPRRLFAGRNA
jgi:predicted RNA-binding Zn ribbon-like protein